MRGPGHDDARELKQAFLAAAECASEVVRQGGEAELLEQALARSARCALSAARSLRRLAMARHIASIPRCGAAASMLSMTVRFFHSRAV